MELRIDQLVYGGSGLARTEDGRVALIPFTLPGETVEIESLTYKNNIYTSFPSLIKVAHSLRVNPPCPYYMHCGGCHYQHMTYDAQLTTKKIILMEQLGRIAGNVQTVVENTTASNKTFNYRNHVQFHLDSEGKPGFQMASSHDVVPVTNCLLLEDSLNALLPSLSFEPHTGLQRIALRDDGMGDPLLFLTGNTINPPEFEVDFPLNVVYRGPAGDMILSGEGYNVFSMLGREFKVSAGSFFQINRSIAEKIINLLLQVVDQEQYPTILDCYCGVGLFSAFLAERTNRLIGIESSEDACADFTVNLDRYDAIELYQGNVEVVLPNLDIHPGLVIVDPPRAGIAPAAIRALIKCHPRKIFYVSCDPSTLARDSKILTGSGYQIDSITPLDMFPQTYHIETVTVLSVQET
ncbi:MAG: class I SAM-dependent RNA methyltransferase [Leptolinea sp.]|jgi:23S rRNA (uracil1939-C5)-methyltransferase|nr:class I SAM-dependent RNA methyltransferase [Leptolinea sp.]